MFTSKIEILGENIYKIDPLVRINFLKEASLTLEGQFVGQPLKGSSHERFYFRQTRMLCIAFSCMVTIKDIKNK
jgi:hypothetical protein